jgi:transposase-like protein
MPEQLQAFEAEKQRLGGEVLVQGLWTTEEARRLDQVEEFLFTKWSRRAAENGPGWPVEPRSVAQEYPTSHQDAGVAPAARQAAP